MNYKIKMNKKDFFKVNNRILTSNIVIEDEDVIFEVELGSYNILKKLNYEFFILESIADKTKRLTKRYALILLGLTFMISILYINSYRVSEIVFNRETSINQSIKTNIEESYKQLLFFDFIDLDFNEYSKDLCKKYFEYPYINVSKQNNKIYVYIADVNEVSIDKNLSKGNLVSKYTGIVDIFYVYEGTSLVYKNKLVNENDVLIEGESSKGLVMGTTYKKVNVKIKKEESLFEYSNKSLEYKELILFNKVFKIGKKEEFSNFDRKEEVKFNLFNFFIIKKIVELEKNVIIKTYTLDQGLTEAKNKIENEFYKEVSNEMEKILSITNITKVELEDLYEYCFIVKSYESFGIYEE